MPAPDLIGILVLGFGLGMLHALDADHILAVSSLSLTGRGPRPAWRFCVRWALGHGAVLLIAGVLVFLAGYAIPAAWSDYAEGVVGLVMIALGLWVLVDLRRRRLHLHFHRHDGLPAHAHWHAHRRDLDHSHTASHRHGHGATLVGALHGLAGSAPLLALLPLARSEAGWLGLFYLLTFSIGVLLAMLLFGGVLGRLMGWLDRRGTVWLQRLRLLVALAAIAVGGRLLLGAV